MLFITAGKLILQRSGKSARTIKSYLIHEIWPISQFSQFLNSQFLRKRTEIVASRGHILRLKMHQIRFPLVGSLQRSPRPLAEFKEPTPKEGRGKREGKGGKGERRVERGGREGWGKVAKGWEGEGWIGREAWVESGGRESQEREGQEERSGK